jgi:DNA polymerase-3 subunit delta'
VVLQPEDKPSIGIDQVRDMLDEMALAPVESPLRVFVIDPASKLQEAAQNALLKGLEEPPSRALVVLLAEHEGELESTIVSRCRVVRTGELTLPEVEQVLRRAGLEAADAFDRARWSGGSPGMALEEDALEVARLTSQTLEDFASGAAYQDPMETGERLLGFATSGTGETAEAKRQRISKTLRQITRALRDALLRRVGGEPSLSGAEPALVARLARLPRGRLEAALDAIVVVEEELTRNANTKLVLDGLVLDVGAALAPAR